ncbi:U3 small nucleolar RNA-interacting protein 2 [Chelonus insularis]|uniref:U3 small nucleolar RNA-interacting protein 2 n=1 Tax=Chelonus insularis TaxID=460826 RepID=UPI00158A2269|nr:U3 small nucleolar RNA-interacting protein 2 [Chelonus insularis]
MSFFIRNNQGKKSLKRKISQNVPTQNGINNGVNSKKKSAKKTSKFDDNESIASSDEEFIEQNRREEDGNFSNASEDEHETAQEKRLRLAKKYLAEIEEEEKDKAEFEKSAVSRRLREEYLEEKGRLRKRIADNYTGHENIIELKCKDHKDSVTCICLSNDGENLYSGSKDGSLVKWSLVNKTKVNSICGKRKTPNGIKSVLCMAVSSDKKFLVVGDSGSKDIKVFNGNDLKHVKNLSGHRGAVTGLAFRRDTHILYSASEDRSVKVWNLDEMAYVESLFGHQSAITSIDALTRERAITSGGFDRSIRLWKIVEESQLIFNGHENSIDAVKFINEDTFLSCGDDGQLCVWSVMKKKPLCSVTRAHGTDETNGQAMWISSIATLLNTDLVASGSRDGKVRLWKCGDSFKSLTLLFEVEIVGFVNSMAFTQDGKNLVVGIGQEHKLGRWWRIPEAKNKIIVISLLQKNETNAAVRLQGYSYIHSG